MRHISSQTALRNVCSGTCRTLLIFVLCVQLIPPRSLLRLTALLRRGGDAVLFLYLCYVCSEFHHKATTLNYVPRRRVCVVCSGVCYGLLGGALFGSKERYEGC